MTEHPHAPDAREAERGRLLPPLDSFAFTGNELAGRVAPARPWHVPQMMPQRAVTLLQGDGGTGKSVLALQLAASTALGRLWLGRDVRRGNVLYLSAEDDRDEMHRRLEAITVEHGADLADLTAFKALDLAGQDACLALADRSGRLYPTDRWGELTALAEAWEPALIVLDNLADVFGGEENSRPQARQFIGMLQRLARDRDAAVLLIGHPSLAGIASGSGSSGSTAWSNSVRSRLYLTRAPQADDGFSDPEARVLAVKKANYGPANIEVRLKWAAGAFQAEEGASAPTLGAIDRQVAEQAMSQTFLRLLTAYDAQGRHVSDKPGANYAPTVFARDPESKGVGRRGLELAMNRLLHAGALRVEMIGRPSKQVRKLARTLPPAEEPDA